MFQYAMKLVDRDDERKKQIEERKLMRLNKNLKKNSSSIDSMSTHCCNFIFYLAIGITLYILATYYFKQTEYDPDYI